MCRMRKRPASVVKNIAALRTDPRAGRFLNHDHSPLSLACYDLLTQETLGSEPWLAVRNTDWSNRARLHFTNTLRTMLVVATAGPRV